MNLFQDGLHIFVPNNKTKQKYNLQLEMSDILIRFNVLSQFKHNPPPPIPHVFMWSFSQLEFAVILCYSLNNNYIMTFLYKLYNIYYLPKNMFL